MREQMQWQSQEAQVAPFTGAWIEMRVPALYLERISMVAPFTGAWIEILVLFRRV